MSFLKIFSPAKIKDKLLKTSVKISSGLSAIFTHKKLDEDLLIELEELLLSSDMGVVVTNKIINNLKLQKFNKEISPKEVKEFLSDEIVKILLPCQKSLMIDSNSKPHIIIINGVNGAGKTTTIGKIAQSLSMEGKKVMIAAGDTFRAAAVEQLKVWSDRANCDIIEPLKDCEDPASIAHRAFMEAQKSAVDVLLIDTAGRLQNKQNLMDELKKVNQVLKKIVGNSVLQNILILDATTGQNAKNQLEVFDQQVNISGIIITKLDGSAKGGVVVALAEQFKKPIYAIGVGEKIVDLQEFNATDFARNLVGFELTN